MELIQVAHSPEAMVNGVAVSPAGRIFSSFPRWTDKPTPCVAEVMQDGSFRPFPGGAWNDWAPGLPSEERFVAVHGVFADRWNNLWVVDDAAPRQASDAEARPKLVQIDLRDDRVTRVYRMDMPAPPPGAVLGHARVDAQHAYVTESHGGAIIVVDRASGRCRRLLEGDPRTLADRTILPIIDGTPFRKSGGENIVINLNLLELSGEWLYFTCLFGPMLRRIPLAALNDESLSPAAVAAQIEDVARIPPCAGIMGDGRGNLYLSSFTENAIRRLRPNGTSEIIIADSRISFPNEGQVGPDRFLYFPASQAHRITMHQPDHISRVRPPWEVLKIDLSKAPA